MLFGARAKAEAELVEAQRENRRLRGELERSKERVWELMAEEQLRKAAEAEVARLTAILMAHPVEPDASAAPRPAEPAAEPPMPRVLSGFEVVSRATHHRNIHNKAAEGR